MRQFSSRHLFALLFFLNLRPGKKIFKSNRATIVCTTTLDGKKEKLSHQMMGLPHNLEQQIPLFFFTKS
jgi:hypothetical protein